uniref:Exonuclease n=1 Tax=Streptomyces phage Scarif TaxID=3158858 RepID=A0AAU7GZ20_9CAUD
MLSQERFTGFRSHPNVEGSHAFLSPSNYHWLNYPEEKLIERLSTVKAAALGSRLHAWAAESILLKREQPRDGDIIAAYVNDAIEYGMTPEQSLWYSIHCFGTTDAISFDPEEMFLRIHDLKTGVSKASFDQLYIYAGLFCLEYEYKPFEVQGELRIYQGHDVDWVEIDVEYLSWVYSKIRWASERIDVYTLGA